MAASVPKGPPLSAQAAILIDGNTGQILYGRDIRGEFYPASITKIMTAYLAITHGWNRTVVVSEAAQNQIGSSAYLRAGEKLPMPRVVTAMMLVSGNDAAYAVARTVAGSVPAFVRLMNAQAAAWGAPGIHFDNPDGLPDPKHVVTALGMAIIARHAMENPTFAKIVATKESTLPPDPKPRVYYNQNLLLYQYPGAIGVKIGYTIEADETIVGAAKRHGLYLIEVLLHDTPSGLWPDAENLLTWGFQHFTTRTLVQNHARLGSLQVGGRHVSVAAAASLTYDVPNGQPVHPTVRLTALHPQDGKPITRGQKVGVASISLGSTEVGTVPVVATQRVASLPPVVHHDWTWLVLPMVVLFSLVSLSRTRAKGRRVHEGRWQHG
ncbi:D-alanyl-D-alanine carboxypeptidase [Sulfobacillus sp. DSM 109850]|uniref:serine-type D-Ala-D-Ala carboxypeptidase n=2 Tax=Sulfobacillus harzensis TaxID=2729629 RepID=A0A7Y0L2S6_9FIRM|nr:D-alanyl-D-alanine carboxypeptidase family protein [Sulfobacillus harzensis]NMP20829.1 D-alanyl-D-alanine carboxypeptidase [Sulfobacillus harzensis]